MQGIKKASRFALIEQLKIHSMLNIMISQMQIHAHTLSPPLIVCEHVCTHRISRPCQFFSEFIYKLN